MTTHTYNTSQPVSFTLDLMSEARPRDRERRFLQRYGWIAYQATDRNGGRVWLWSHRRYRCSYYRGQAFAMQRRWQSR